MDKWKKLQREKKTLAEQVSELRARCETLTKANESLVQNAKELVAANEDLKQEKADLQSKLKKSRAELDALIRRLFGRTSERFEDPDQLKFEFANQAQVDDARDGIEQAVLENNRTGGGKKPPKRRNPKERFPDGLERKEVVVDLSEEQKEGLVRIGEDIVESAHYTRAKVYVIRTIYPKYARPGEPESGVFQAERPATLLQGNRYDISFAAAIIANRLSYHLPIYRQEDMFSECGLYLSRSTLLNIQEAAERVLRPFAEWLADLVRTDTVIGSD
ncbi:transposase, partial [Stieleria sp. ICT_E10.1]|uniref:IS66 family transposase n=1 Tax=Stieleria sedimenti TaxID=2976331 RepID=UPI00217FA517